MPVKNDFNIVTLVNNDGCFDLQFRKDTRHERTNSPTYYRWKTQFVVTSGKNDLKILNKLQNELGCGTVTVSRGQARFSVQKIDDIINTIIPFFKKNCLSQNKKKDFELWAKGASVIFQNKGKQLSTWHKNDLCTLLEIHKSSSKYKNNPRLPKWIDMAKSLVKSC